MSEPNPLSFLTQRRSDEKMEGVKALLSSDKNNETKTRIWTVYAMTYFDYLGGLSSPKKSVSYEFQNEKKELPKTVEGMAAFFGMRYRINAISKEGLSRYEYVDAYKSYAAGMQELVNTAAQARAEEGVKKVR